MTLFSGSSPFQSLNAVTTGTGTALDNGATKLWHSLFVVAGTGTTAGAVRLEFSNDGVNWATTAANFAPSLSTNNVTPTLSAAGVYGCVVQFPAQFVRATVSSTITNGTASAWVASA